MVVESHGQVHQCVYVVKHHVWWDDDGGYDMEVLGNVVHMDNTEVLCCLVLPVK
jgi:hypothetical protein